MIRDDEKTRRTARRRARRLTAAALAEQKIAFPAVDPVLVQRPRVAEIRGAGVVVREAVRWSA